MDIQQELSWFEDFKIRYENLDYTPTPHDVDSLIRLIEYLQKPNVAQPVGGDRGLFGLGPLDDQPYKKHTFKPE